MEEREEGWGKGGRKELRGKGNGGFTPSKEASQAEAPPSEFLRGNVGGRLRIIALLYASTHRQIIWRRGPSITRTPSKRATQQQNPHSNPIKNGSRLLPDLRSPQFGRRRQSVFQRRRLFRYRDWGRGKHRENGNANIKSGHSGYRNTDISQASAPAPRPSRTDRNEKQNGLKFRFYPRVVDAGL